MRRGFLTAILLGMGILVAACAPRLDPQGLSPGAEGHGALGPSHARVEPRILASGPRLECVPYARSASGIAIYGDAWTWWASAEGEYRRGDRPSLGAVLVLRRTNRLSAGHLATVTEIISDREIVVRHANWLNRGQIHLDTPVVDVSPDNDWSAVRVWYTPGHSYGASKYAVRGFIYPERLQAMR